jgi:arylsulfatase A-like enzyme
MSDGMKNKFGRRDFVKLMALLPLLGIMPRGTPATKGPAAQRTAPSVLVFVFDALSARNMSLYGYPRETTPQLERFAQRSTVYHRHYASGNFTSPGAASILSGALPWTHRAFNTTGTMLPEFANKNLFSLLGQAGYYCSGYSHNPLVTSLLYELRHSLDLFRRHDELFSLVPATPSSLFAEDYVVASTADQSTWPGNSLKQLPPSWILAAIDKVRAASAKNQQQGYGAKFPGYLPTFDFEGTMDWIAEQLRIMPRPFAAYFHVLPPHNPYHSPREFANLFKDQWAPPAKPVHHFSVGIAQEELNSGRRQYDCYVRYADSDFGRLLDQMEQNGILDEAIVLVTSDHGEQFERGNLFHGGDTLYEPLLHVPLLISVPGQRERRDIFSPSSAADVLPTIAQLTGQPLPTWSEGRPLPGSASDAPTGGQASYALAALRSAKWGRLTIGTAAMVNGDYKLIHYFGYPGYSDVHELYDLKNDPEELSDLASVRRELATDLLNQLHEKLDAVNRQFPST